MLNNNTILKSPYNYGKLVNRYKFNKLPLTVRYNRVPEELRGISLEKKLLEDLESSNLGDSYYSGLMESSLPYYEKLAMIMRRESPLVHSVLPSGLRGTLVPSEYSPSEWLYGLTSGTRIPINLGDNSHLMKVVLGFFKPDTVSSDFINLVRATPTGNFTVTDWSFSPGGLAAGSFTGLWHPNGWDGSLPLPDVPVNWTDFISMLHDMTTQSGIEDAFVRMWDMIGDGTVASVMSARNTIGGRTGEDIPDFSESVYDLFGADKLMFDHNGPEELIGGGFEGVPWAFGAPKKYDNYQVGDLAVMASEHCNFTFTSQLDPRSGYFLDVDAIAQLNNGSFNTVNTGFSPCFSDTIVTHDVMQLTIGRFWDYAASSERYNWSRAYVKSGLNPSVAGFEVQFSNNRTTAQTPFGSMARLADLFNYTNCTSDSIDVRMFTPCLRLLQAALVYGANQSSRFRGWVVGRGSADYRVPRTDDVVSNDIVGDGREVIFVNIDVWLNNRQRYQDFTPSNAALLAVPDSTSRNPAIPVDYLILQIVATMGIDPDTCPNYETFFTQYNIGDGLIEQPNDVRQHWRDIAGCFDVQADKQKLVVLTPQDTGLLVDNEWIVDDGQNALQIYNMTEILNFYKLRLSSSDMMGSITSLVDTWRCGETWDAAYKWGIAHFSFGEVHRSGIYNVDATQVAELVPNTDVSRTVHVESDETEFDIQTSWGQSLPYRVDNDSFLNVLLPGETGYEWMIISGFGVVAEEGTMIATKSVKVMWYPERFWLSEFLCTIAYKTCFSCGYNKEFTVNRPAWIVKNDLDNFWNSNPVRVNSITSGLRYYGSKYIMKFPWNYCKYSETRYRNGGNIGHVHTVKTPCMARPLFIGAFLGGVDDCDLVGRTNYPAKYPRMIRSGNQGIELIGGNLYSYGQNTRFENIPSKSISKEQKYFMNMCMVQDLEDNFSMRTYSPLGQLELDNNTKWAYRSYPSAGIGAVGNGLPWFKPAQFYPFQVLAWDAVRLGSVVYSVGNQIGDGSTSPNLFVPTSFGIQTTTIINSTLASVGTISDLGWGDGESAETEKGGETIIEKVGGPDISGTPEEGG